MSDLPVTIYTPESPLRRPATLARQMLGDLVRSRELAWRLFVRDTSAQYRQSILGYIWIFIPPLVSSLPFIFLNTQGLVKINDTPIPYGAYAIIGTTIWQAFVDALNAPLRTVTLARPMLTRINLPHEALLLSALAQVGLGFVVRLALLIIVLAWFHIIPPITAALFPLGITSLVLFGFLIGVLLTPLGLLYSDVQHAVPVATTFLMLLTPVLYPVPESGLAHTIAKFNPLTPLVVVTRDWLTIGNTTHTTGFIVVTVFATALLLVGWVIFRVAMPHLIARIGN